MKQKFSVIISIFLRTDDIVQMLLKKEDGDGKNLENSRNSTHIHVSH